MGSLPLPAVDIDPAANEPDDAAANDDDDAAADGTTTTCAAATCSTDDAAADDDADADVCANTKNIEVVVQHSSI